VDLLVDRGGLPHPEVQDLLGEGEVQAEAPEEVYIIPVGIVEAQALVLELGEEVPGGGEVVV